MPCPPALALPSPDQPTALGPRLLVPWTEPSIYNLATAVALALAAAVAVALAQTVAVGVTPRGA